MINRTADVAFHNSAFNDIILDELSKMWRQIGIIRCEHISN